MLRKKLFKFLIIIVCIFVPYYYAKNKGYVRKLEEFVITHFRNFIVVRKVEIKGNSLLSVDEILKICDVKEGSKLYQYSAQTIRDTLLTRQEISDVNVQINYSGTIKILIDEKKPFGIWWNGDIPCLIDKNGDEILKIKNVEEYHNLVVIFGANINKKLKNFLDVIREYRLYQNVISMHYVGNRRWDVYLHNNVVLKLPEHNIAVALAKAEKVLKSLKYQNKIDILDLRLYPKKVFLRLKSIYD